MASLYNVKVKSVDVDDNKSTLNTLLYKTVFSLSCNRLKNFGILVPADNRYGVIAFSNDGYTRSHFDIQDFLTLGGE